MEEALAGEQFAPPLRPSPLDSSASNPFYAPSANVSVPPSPANSVSAINANTNHRHSNTNTAALSTQNNTAMDDTQHRDSTTAHTNQGSMKTMSATARYDPTQQRTRNGGVGKDGFNQHETSVPAIVEGGGITAGIRSNNDGGDNNNTITNDKNNSSSIDDASLRKTRRDLASTVAPAEARNEEANADDHNSSDNNAAASSSVSDKKAKRPSAIDTLNSKTAVVVDDRESDPNRRVSDHSSGGSTTRAAGAKQASNQFSTPSAVNTPTTTPFTQSNRKAAAAAAAAASSAATPPVVAIAPPPVIGGGEGEGGDADRDRGGDGVGAHDDDAASSRSSSESRAAPATAATMRIDVLNYERNQAREYPNNAICTSKYTVVSFLPLNLFEQFRRLSNFYFLVVMTLTLIPGASPVNPFSAIVPLALVVGVAAIKDAYEDFRRHRSDAKANSVPALVLRNGEFVEVASEDVLVGDVLKIHHGEEIRADCVLLSSSLPEGMVYIETSNLDGETNAKTKRAPAASYAAFQNEHDLMAKCHVSEPPEMTIPTRCLTGIRTMPSRFVVGLKNVINSFAEGMGLSRLPEDEERFAKRADSGEEEGEGAATAAGHDEACEMRTIDNNPAIADATNTTALPIDNAGAVADADHNVTDQPATARPGYNSTHRHSNADGSISPTESDPRTPAPNAVTAYHRRHRPGFSGEHMSTEGVGEEGIARGADAIAGEANSQAAAALSAAASPQSPTPLLGGKAQDGEGKAIDNTHNGHSATDHHNSKYGVRIIAAMPDANLSYWQGVLKFAPNESYSLGLDNFLFRGAILRNTEWALGAVVYSGVETKMFLNLKQKPPKRSQFDKQMNVLMLVMFILTVFLVVLFSSLGVEFHDDNAAAWYLNPYVNNRDKVTIWGWRFITHFILLSYLIPISLFITLEINKGLQVFFISMDGEMGDFNPETREWRLCRSKTSNLTSQLGRVKYIFADKTGTLTENCMKFVGGHIDAIVFKTHDKVPFVRVTHAATNGATGAPEGGGSCRAGSGTPHSNAPDDHDDGDGDVPSSASSRQRIESSGGSGNVSDGREGGEGGGGGGEGGGGGGGGGDEDDSDNNSVVACSANNEDPTDGSSARSNDYRHAAGASRSNSLGGRRGRDGAAEEAPPPRDVIGPDALGFELIRCGFIPSRAFLKKKRREALEEKRLELITGVVHGDASTASPRMGIGAAAAGAGPSPTAADSLANTATALKRDALQRSVIDTAMDRSFFQHSRSKSKAMMGSMRGGLGGAASGRRESLVFATLAAQHSRVGSTMGGMQLPFADESNATPSFVAHSRTQSRVHTLDIAAMAAGMGSNGAIPPALNSNNDVLAGYRSTGGGGGTQHARRRSDLALLASNNANNNDVTGSGNSFGIQHQRLHSLGAESVVSNISAYGSSAYQLLERSSLFMYLLSLSACHNVVCFEPRDTKPAIGAEEGGGGAPIVKTRKIYEGQSLDEVALVRAAADNFFELVERSSKEMIIEIMGRCYTYDIIAELEFTPQRKLMSIILRRNRSKDQGAQNRRASYIHSRTLAASMGGNSFRHGRSTSRGAGAKPSRTQSISMSQRGLGGGGGAVAAGGGGGVGGGGVVSPSASIHHLRTTSQQAILNAGTDAPVDLHAIVSSGAFASSVATSPNNLNSATANNVASNLAAISSQQQQLQANVNNSSTTASGALIDFIQHRHTMSDGSYRNMHSFTNSYGGGGGGGGHFGVGAPQHFGGLHKVNDDDTTTLRIIDDADDTVFPYLMLTKGADSSMLPLIDMSVQVNQDMSPAVEESLHAMAVSGLRTLVLGYRRLSQQDVDAFLPILTAANQSMGDRNKLLHEAYETIEKQFTLIGATAVEDKLQDGVPETIDFFIRAKVVVWMLTGDKRETAVTIAGTSGIIDPSHNEAVVHIDVTHFPDEEKIREVSEQICRAKAVIDANPPNTVVLVIDGVSLNAALQVDPSEDDASSSCNFFELGSVCRAAVCCRMTPLQKADVVRMFQTTTGHVALAIGDGANDVSMIQEAEIGIGIMGLEGAQAELASDFAIPKFRYLKRLMVVHGRHNLYRDSQTVLFCVYKCIVIVVCLSIYTSLAGYSGQAAFNSWFLSMYNSFYCQVQCLAIGILDKDLPDAVLESNPLLYPELAEKKTYFNPREWILTIIEAGLVGMALSLACLTSLRSDDISMEHTMSLADQGSIWFIAIILVMDTAATLRFLRSWTYVTIGTMIFGYAMLLVFTFALCSILNFGGTSLAGVAVKIFAVFTFYAQIALAVGGFFVAISLVKYYVMDEIIFPSTSANKVVERVINYQQKVISRLRKEERERAREEALAVAAEAAAALLAAEAVDGAMAVNEDLMVNSGNPQTQSGAHGGGGGDDLDGDEGISFAPRRQLAGAGLGADVNSSSNPGLNTVNDDRNSSVVMHNPSGSEAD